LQEVRVDSRIKLERSTFSPQHTTHTAVGTLHTADTPAHLPTLPPSFPLSIALSTAGTWLHMATITLIASHWASAQSEASAHQFRPSECDLDGESEPGRALCGSKGEVD
jgi:hypothetical protein